MVSYGTAWPCARCNGQDDDYHTISSNDEVERMADNLADWLEPLCRDRGRMLGVMFADNEWIVTLSHVAAVQQEFVNAVMKLGHNMCPIAHDWSTVPKRSLGGYDISPLLVSERAAGAWNAYFEVKAPDGSMRREGRAGGPGCVCTAPKLISYLLQDAGAHLLPPREIAMIELWCGAPLRNAEGQILRLHKQVAESCGNCKKILPTLFCRQPV